MNQTIIAAVDDMFFASKIRATAEHLNLEVRFVRSIEVALAAAIERNADLAIVDLQSQKIDSLELAKRWRSDPRVSTIPLIGFFSHVEIELQRSALAAGFDRVLPRSQFSRDLAAIISGNRSTSGSH